MERYESPSLEVVGSKNGPSTRGLVAIAVAAVALYGVNFTVAANVVVFANWPKV